MDNLRKAALEYFNEKQISYKNITSGDICTLVIILNKNLKLANKEGLTSVNTMRMSEKIDSKYSSAGTLLECFLYMNSHYFTRRECISFYRDGTISFCDWADGSNTKVITDSFREWVETIF